MFHLRTSASANAHAAAPALSREPSIPTRIVFAIPYDTGPGGPTYWGFVPPALPSRMPIGLQAPAWSGPATAVRTNPARGSPGHIPMLSWNQIPVEISLLNHLPPPPERPLSHWRGGKSFLPRPVRLHVILMHQFPDLITANTSQTNSHGCSCSLQSLTDSQPA